MLMVDAEGTEAEIKGREHLHTRNEMKSGIRRVGIINPFLCIVKHARFSVSGSFPEAKTFAFKRGFELNQNQVWQLGRESVIVVRDRVSVSEVCVSAKNEIGFRRLSNRVTQRSN